MTRMKTLSTIYNTLKNIVLIAQRLNRIEQRLSAIDEKLDEAKRDRLAIDRRLLRLEHFFEFASRYLPRR